MLNELMVKVERQQAGLDDPIDEAMQQPIEEHLADFEKSQKAKNNSPRYVLETAWIGLFCRQCAFLKSYRDRLA